MADYRNTDAERALLGAMLINKAAIDKVRAMIYPEDFSLGLHQIVYRAILSVRDQDIMPDLVSLSNQLQGMGELSKIGGASFLVELIETVPTAANIGYYARIVREQALIREIVDAGMVISNTKKVPSADQFMIEAVNAVGNAQKRHQALAGREISTNEAVDMALEEIYALRDGKTLGYEILSLPTLQRTLHGIQSLFHVIAAASSVGKTTLLGQLQADMERQGAPGIIYSLETPAHKLAKRRIFSILGEKYSGFTEEDLETGRINEGDVVAAAAQVAAYQTLVAHGFNHIDRIIAHAKAHLASGKYKWVALDYLQLISAKRKSNDTRAGEITEIVNRLKTEIQCEFNVPFILLSQLNTEVIKDGKRPKKEDMKESGTTGEAADVVIILYPQMDRNQPTGVININVEKNRDGALADIPAARVAGEFRFVEIASEYVGYRTPARDIPANYLYSE